MAIINFFRIIFALPVILFKTALRFVFSCLFTLPVTCWFLFSDLSWKWIIVIAIPAIMKVIITVRRWRYEREYDLLGMLCTW